MQSKKKWIIGLIVGFIIGMFVIRFETIVKWLS